jgi:CheY-like chemotaxis protein
MHGGGVSVESEPNKGSRFTISLPWFEANEFVDEPEDETIFGDDVSSLQKALLIEGLSSAADQIRYYLAELNIGTIVHTQGSDAVAKAIDVAPDFIILDIHLPDASGWEVLNQFKAEARTRDIPLLPVSMLDESSLTLADNAAHLVRPISREKLHLGLHRILSNKQISLNDHPPDFEASKFEALDLTHSSTPVILLAEDNQNNINTLSDYLILNGYQVVVARNGNEAISRAREEQPDLILMDIQMPGMDGLEATRQIRADLNPALATVPIIAITALSMPGDKERCLAAGANEYMSKPVSLKGLMSMIRNNLINNPNQAGSNAVVTRERS